jgi:hypothetical protein
MTTATSFDGLFVFESKFCYVNVTQLLPHCWYWHQAPASTNSSQTTQKVKAATKATSTARGVD